ASCGSDIFENIVAKFAPLPKSLLAQTQGRAARTVIVSGLIGAHQPGRVRKWQRPEQSAFDDGENCGVRSNAESKDQNRDRIESWRLHQHAEGVFKISKHMFLYSVRSA